MDDLALYLLRSAGCLALFYGFYRIALARDNNFGLNRAYLLGSAVLSMALPLIHVPSPLFKRLVPASALSFSTPQTSGAPVTSAGGGTVDVLLAAYIAGASILLVLFLVRIIRLFVLAARCGCERHRGLRVVLCGHPGESFSFFNFVFLNKANIPPGDLDRVLAHELAHVRQLHSADVILTEILSIVQWFNPFVWPYKRSLRETHEYLADRAAVAQGCGLARYQLLIVEQHVGGKLFELASGFRASQIKRRITMLSKQESKGLARWKPFLILPLALVLVLAFAEARLVVQAGPAAAPATVQSGAQESGKSAKAGAQAEDEMIKALKEKAAQLEEMRAKNGELLSKLQQKLEATSDPQAKAELTAKLKEQKLMSLELSAKERILQVKKLEMALNKEDDAAKKADIEKKMQLLKAESEDYLKKVEQVRSAEEKAKLEAKKK